MTDRPLNAKEQAMIDAAWETHKAAAPKTLLDGFGEATDEVVALRARVAELEQANRAMAEVVEAARKARTLVDRQAEDDGLWFLDVHITEAYLQQELRRLHAVVEAIPLARLDATTPEPPK